MRYFLHLAYRGTAYRGWQRQADAPSVQAQVEDAISHVLKERTYVGGCGRTDAEVHARQFFAHVDIEDPWDYDLKFRINKMLPRDIAVYDIIPVAENAHARYDAVARTYDYFIHRYADPFLHPNSAQYLYENLDIEAMQVACALLTQYEDYGGLCRKPDQQNTTICKVTHAQLHTNAAQDLLRFEITADRYLMGMVRIIVGQLLEIGRGLSDSDVLRTYLERTAVLKEKISAHPQGLYLSGVRYPYLDIPAKTDFSQFGLLSMQP